MAIRPKRRAGELLADAEMKPGPKPIDHTLVSIGITPNDSYRWQAVATFEEAHARVSEAIDT